jgi:hypothetical protein
MKKPSLSFCLILVVGLALGVGEAAASLSSRKKEKAQVYAALKPWEKKYIDKGTIATGFTPDMVYIAMGKPSKVESKDLPEGHVDMWTYTRVYPDLSSLRGFTSAPFTPESAFQTMPATTQSAAGSNPNAIGGSSIPRGMDRGGGESISKTGGPQGGSMEPAAPPSYTIQVIFTDGKTSKMSAVPNMN